MSIQNKRSFDLMITLHACDTATDYAPARCKMECSCYLAVPCCQHELNANLTTKSTQFAAFLKYGIIKERFSALQQINTKPSFESSGYFVQLLELLIWNIHQKHID